jgi:hypothetical protein
MQEGPCFSDMPKSKRDSSGCQVSGLQNDGALQRGKSKQVNRTS